MKKSINVDSKKNINENTQMFLMIRGNIQLHVYAGPVWIYGNIFF